MKRTTIKYIFIYFFFCPLLLYSNNNAKENGNIFTVVIDAGHGGNDPGALGKYSRESDLALAIALKTGEYIEKFLKDVKVVYTRTTDVSVGLMERAEIANKCKAQLIISIHINSNPSPKPYGTSTYVLGLHRADENFEVAKRENSVILLEEDYETKYQGFDPNSPESLIMFSLMQDTYLNQSIEMAAFVQEQFRERVSRKDLGVKQLGLLVLAQSSMPGILIEAGFISNPKEEQFLVSKEGQDYLASAIYRAFRDYKNVIDLKSNVSTGKDKEVSEFTEVRQEPVNKYDKEPAEKKTIVSSNEVKTSDVDKDKTGKIGLEDQKKTVLPDIKSEINDTIVVFRIQISSSMANIQNSSYFRGIEKVDVYESEGMFKYVTGKGTDYDQAKKNLEEIKKIFPDAFIVAVKNGEIIPLQQAFQETGLKSHIIN